MYYECHITLGLTPISAKPLIEALGWKFSCIDGDPSLGDGPREYATRHVSTKVEFTTVKDEMDRIAYTLACSGFLVIRRKIELVMYDTKGREGK